MVELSRVDKNGISAYEHLALASEHGDLAAQKVFDDIPTYDEEVEYLVDWARQLHGRSGAAGFGIAPLNPVVLKAWAEMLDIAPLHPLEVDALFMLTDALANSATEGGTGNEPAGEDPPILPKSAGRRKWPKRQNQE